ncbi:MAG: metal-dependent hydrolase [Bradyrhizobium sp.]
MPSPIAHALAGAAIARLAPTRRHVIACATLAAVPDVDLLLPIMHRTVTHSVTAVGVTLIIAASVTGGVTRWKTAGLYALAYGSHLLLDWLGADPNPPFGIQMFWPFSNRWFISGADLFPPTIRGLVTRATMLQNLRAVAVEVAIILPIVSILWVVLRPRDGATSSNRVIG